MTASHRRELDGLRTVAVMVVLLFHAGLRGFDGGFIGVDTFFVLSGFLITGLLLGEARGGRIDLVAFYARRSRRLLPAALLTVVVTSAVWLLTSSVIARRALVGDAQAASLYVANWHFVRQTTDYFADGGAESPFLHFWSLAAEEQFYFVWPAVLVGLVLLTRWRDRLHHLPRAVRVVALVLGTASLVSLIATTAADNESLAYFGTHHRVYQLMVGAALATVDWRAAPPAVRRAGERFAAIPLAVLMVLATSLVDTGPGLRGFAATAAAAMLVAALTVGGAATPTARLLSTAPMVRLGELSYGIYLWHWPVILVLQRFVTERHAVVAVVATAASAALAWLSHVVVERRIRFSTLLQRHHRVVIASGLALSAAVGLVIAPVILETASRPVFVSNDDLAAFADRAPTTDATSPETTVVSSMPSIEKVLDASTKADPLECAESVGPACLVHRGGAATVLVIGDSHLLAFENAFAGFAAEHDLTMWIAAQSLCPWLYDVVEAGALKRGCREMHQAVYDQLLPSLRPDSIIVLNRAYDDPLKSTRFIGPDGEVTAASEALVAHLPDAIDRLLESTPRVVVVEPWPSLSINQRECLTVASVVTDCIASAAPRPLPSDSVVADIAARDSRVVVVSISDLVCPRLPTCDAVVSGEVVRTDTNHLNRAFTATIVDEFLRRLVAAGAFGTVS
ncbi:MAG: acyltransferase family protein [Ilumatobacteraceae bacterium]